MKKLIYCAAALAAMIFAGSCQQENLEPVAQESTVTFSVELPGVQTKAIGDGFNVDQLVYEVWKTENPNVRELNNPEAKATRLYQETTKLERIDDEQKTIITLNLVHDQNYTILFWAQNSKAIGEEGAETPAYVTSDLTAVTYAEDVKNGSYPSNNENMAAFYGVAFLKAEEVETPSTRRVELKRPFAQLNIGTLNTVDPNEYKIEMISSKVTVRYVPTVFNVAENIAADSKNGTQAEPAVSKIEEFVFSSEDVPNKTEKLKVNDAEYEYAAMNYIFANGNVEVEYWIDAELTVTDLIEGRNQTTNATIHNIVQQVPLMENYRTNIVGNLLTSSAQYEVVIDKNFNNPEYVIGEEWIQTGEYTYTIMEGASALALKEVLAHANSEARAAATKSEGPVVTINLNGNVEWATEGGHGSSPLLPAESLISKVIINGNGKTFTATGAGVGSIRLANGGLLTFNNVNIVDKTVSYAENAWEFTYLEFAGNLAFNICTFNSGVQFQTEDNEVVLNASFADCQFISNEADVYCAWVSDGITSFNGCTFKGTRGLKIHEDYGSEVISVTVDGCEFGPISKKPGIALGTLNEKTTVTIKDSRFVSCQGGMYETDTDVTTFTFVNENNEVHENPSAMIADWIENASADETVNIPAGEYSFPTSSFKKGVIVKCAEGTVFTESSDLNINGAIVEGATFSNPTGNVSKSTINGTFKNCKFVGSNALRYCYAGETTIFEDCVFDGEVYGVHFDGGSYPVTLRRCQLSGFNTFGSAITELTFEECVFKSTGKSGYNGANLWGKTTMNKCQFIFDGKASTEWIGLNAAGADKKLAFNECVVLDAEGKEHDLAAYFANCDNGYKVTINGEELTIAGNAEGLNNAIKTENAKIVLLPGSYKGSFAINNNGITILGTEGAVVDCINLNGKDNVTLKNITFDAAGATYGYDGVGTKKDYAFSNIITGDNVNKPNKGAHNLVIDGCEFTGAFANPGAPIAFTDHRRGEGASGNITIKNCVFGNTNANYTIYAHYTGDSLNGHGDFIIENNTFNSACYAGPIYLGRYASDVPVKVTGNAFNTVTSIDYAIYVQDHSNYGVSIDASGNTFAE